MLELDLKIKKLHPDTKIPAYAKPGDAGLDLTATSCYFQSSTQCWVYGTGLALEIPDGYVGLIFPRSSISNYDLSLGNAVGVIDNKFRGEITFKFKQTNTLKDEVSQYKVGDRIGQLIIMPYPKVNIKVIDELSTTERGVGGYGSTGV
jgi:dUTP pyrophosphatase